MAYDESVDLGQAGNAGPETNPEPPSPEPQGKEDDTFFLPPDMLKGHKCETGDIIQLEVVGTDGDGDVEVRMKDKNYASKRGSEEWRSDLKSTMGGPSVPPEEEM